MGMRREIVEGLIRCLTDGDREELDRIVDEMTPEEMDEFAMLVLRVLRKAGVMTTTADLEKEIECLKREVRELRGEVEGIKKQVEVLDRILERVEKRLERGWIGESLERCLKWAEKQGAGKVTITFFEKT